MIILIKKYRTKKPLLPHLLTRSISVKQAQAFDKYAQEQLGIPSIVLMENAGRGVAEEALQMLGNRKRVVVVCGVGNNGGDGLVAARHLLNAGIKVEVFIVGKISKLKPDPKTNLKILKKMGIRVKKAGEGLRGLKRAEVIVDAIFGIGLKSEVRGPYAEVINLMNKSGKPILTVDVPSGLDADTGKPFGIAIKAKRTVSFVAVKKGFLSTSGRKHCGRIIVRDIGIK
ncbi:MAG: NAD(P)H-hydrate epimerase [Candidatus Margulisbacteria bacterium]|nr:NAD(P)H-hydrate epimerase [Candidatus Margulisiibacteriota bacterium]